MGADMPLEVLRARWMTLEATARNEAGRTGAGMPGSSGRLLWFVGASFVLHGLVALVLLRGMQADTAERPGATVSAPAAAEMIWFEGAVGTSPAGGAAAPASVLEQKPAPVARAVFHERPLPAVPASKARPRAVPAAPVAAAAEGAPAVEPELKRELPVEPSMGAEVAARGSSEADPDSAPSLPGSEAGTTASGGGVGAPSAAAPGPGGAGSTAGDLRAYARRLPSVVARQRRYPETAVRLGMQGTTLVQIRLRQDGSLVEAPRVVTSSGHDILDAEALRMVEAAAPFEPFPDGASRPDAGFVIPVVFSLRPGH